MSVYTEDTYKDDYAILIDQFFGEREPAALSTQEREALAHHNAVRARQFQKAELALQVSLVELRELLKHAPNEPRLKGPFPVKTYAAMLRCCQSILDKFLSMRIVILKDVWALHVRRSLMRPASQEWMEMAGNILLYFYLLASALQLKTPLPPFLPPAEKARELLIAKLEHVLQQPHEHHDDEGDGYMVYYAYVVMMESIIRELNEVRFGLKEKGRAAMLTGPT